MKKTIISIVCGILILALAAGGFLYYRKNFGLPSVPAFERELPMVLYEDYSVYMYFKSQSATILPLDFKAADMAKNVRLNVGTSKMIIYPGVLTDNILTELASLCDSVKAEKVYIHKATEEQLNALKTESREASLIGRYFIMEDCLFENKEPKADMASLVLHHGKTTFMFARNVLKGGRYDVIFIPDYLAAESKANCVFARCFNTGAGADISTSKIECSSDMFAQMMPEGMFDLGSGEEEFYGSF